MSVVAWRPERRWLEIFYAFFFFFLLSISGIAIDANNSLSQQDNLSSEALALMDFKHSSVLDDPNGFLKSWNNNSKIPSPCSWRGVTCSSSDGRVFSVNLSSAGLTGQLQMNHLINLPNLRYLDLSHNYFLGNFSNLEFGNCSSLLVLNLSQNSLFGKGSPFPASFTNCKFLEKLDLSDNKLDGKISGGPLGKLKNLRYLSLAGNRFSGEIPSICGSLQDLDLSENRLSGVLPLTLVSCSSLLSLRIRFNNISGHIPLTLTNLTNLQLLDLSSNALFGNIPSGFCSSQSSLKEILFAGNFVSGEVPSELGNCKNLETIDFSLNNLTGPIPSEIWTLPNLSDMILWGNQLNGEIPNVCVNGGNLETLILNNNFINGTIPDSLADCKKLTWVSLSHNRLSGKIPDGVGSLLNLVILQLGNNLLTGEIPPGLGDCQSLVWLELNNNGLSGSIPVELAKRAGLIIGRPISRRLGYLRASDRAACGFAGVLVEIEGVRIDRLVPVIDDYCKTVRAYSGMIFNLFTDNGSMFYLDFSHNSLSGTIPESLGSMKYLLVLNLRNNSLSGSIPYSFGSLTNIEILDISNNHLGGRIPGSLGNLDFLGDLDVSNNNLSGSIPQTGQLATFAADRYANNPGLCGYPLLACGSISGPFPTDDHKSYSQSSSEETKFDWIWVIVSIGYASGIPTGIVIGNKIFQRFHERIMETFLGKKRKRDVKWK